MDGMGTSTICRDRRSMSPQMPFDLALGFM
jgi:hypothetical protein